MDAAGPGVRRLSQRRISEVAEVVAVVDSAEASSAPPASEQDTQQARWLPLIVAFIVLASCLVLATALSPVLQPLSRRVFRQPELNAHVVLFTNRQVSAMVVLRSLLAHSKKPKRTAVHIVVADASCCPEVLLFAQRAPFGSVKVYTLGELTLELLEDGHSPAWMSKAKPAASGTAGYLVRQADWDHDGKHATPLNHARFYLPHMRFARDLPRLLFVDDDIVLQSDVMPALEHAMEPDKAMLVSCNAINFDTCGWFRMAWDEMTYAQTSYMGFKAFDVNGLRQEDVICSTADQNECIEPGGFEQLSEVAAQVGSPAFTEGLNLSAIKAWNFGYVVIDIRRWHAFQLTAKYEAWIAANAERRIFAETSLGFGLGLPLLALAGRVQCYSSAVRIFEGLAVMDHFDMAQNNISLDLVRTADVLHYTGEHKPWMSARYAEYSAAFNKFDARLDRDDGLGGEEAHTKKLFVVLGGEHAGSEFLMSQLDTHARVCAAGESKGALDSLRGFARHALMPPLPNMVADGMASDWVRPCFRQAVCTWRHFMRAVTAATDEQLAAYALREDIARWRAAWEASGRNTTALFERFVRATLGQYGTDGGGHLELPCHCPATSTHVGFKFFSQWVLQSPIAADLLARNQWASNYHGPGDSARALEVFKRVGATFIVIDRSSPVMAYLSLQKSLASAEWHCPTGNCLPPNATLTVDVQACRNYVQWYLSAQSRLEALMRDAGISEPMRIVYEDCMADPDACLLMVTNRLGVRRLNSTAVRAQRGRDYNAAMFQKYDDVIQECGRGFS